MYDRKTTIQKFSNRIKNRTIAVHYILKLRRCDVIRVSIKGIDKVIKVDTSFLLVILWYIKKSGRGLHNSVALKENYPTKKNIALI